VQYALLASDNADIGLWLWGPERGCVWMNPYCRDLVGAADSSLPLEVFLGCLAGKQVRAVQETITASVQAETAFHSEFEIKSERGDPLWVLAIGHPIRTSTGTNLAGTLLDITDYKSVQFEREQLRQQVIHLTRVSTIGELSGAMAHELNQPLTAILSNAQAGQRLIGQNAGSNADISSILDDIVEDDRRAGAVLTRLRNLIRNEHIDFSEIDVNEVITEVLKLVNGELLDRRVDSVMELTPALPTVHGDRIQIQQVLINLVRNALDAMGTERWSQHNLAVRSILRRDGSVGVTVSDNGAGVPVNLRANLFEPFITTKSQGMGLGLTISRAIISGHRGEIWCEDNPGGGSTFTFSLPVFERGTAWTS